MVLWSCLTGLVGQCDGVNDIDFESAYNGVFLTHGDQPEVTQPWAGWGITVSTPGSSTNPLFLFDSSLISAIDAGAPETEEIATPNEDFFNGEGVGSGGSMGAVGENSASRSKVLIVGATADLSASLSPAQSGGIVDFTFSTPRTVYALDFINVNSVDPQSYVEVHHTDSNGAAVDNVPISAFEIGRASCRERV